MSDFRLEPSGDMAVQVTRSFCTTSERLRALHLDAERARDWLGSPDMPLVECRIDGREGGTAQYRWQMRDGSTMALEARFEKITPDGIIHHERFDPDWTQGEARVRTDFVPQDGGRCLLRMTVTYADPATRDAVMQSGMAAGLEAAYARLEGLL